MAVYGENVHVTGIPQEILWLWLVPVVLRHPGDSNHLHFGRNFKANTIGCDSNPKSYWNWMGLNPWVGRKMRKGGRTESARWRNIYLPLESHDCHRNQVLSLRKHPHDGLACWSHVMTIGTRMRHNLENLVRRTTVNEANAPKHPNTSNKYIIYIRGYIRYAVYNQIHSKTYYDSQNRHAAKIGELTLQNRGVRHRHDSSASALSPWSASHVTFSLGMSRVVSLSANINVGCMPAMARMGCPRDAEILHFHHA